jgi:hypothetical protein
LVRIPSVIMIINVEDDSENEDLDDHVVEDDEEEEDVKGVEEDLSQPGNKRSPAWAEFSDLEDVTTKKKAKSKHCNKIVSSQKQIKRVLGHLSKCEGFERHLRT